MARNLLAASVGPSARLKRAQLRAFDKIRDRLSITDLERTIALGTQRRLLRLPIGPSVDAAVNRILPKELAEDAQGPSQTIIRETFVRGGKIGAAQINDALRKG